MPSSRTYQWVTQSKRWTTILAGLEQPSTAKQISQRTEISLDCCSYVLAEMVRAGLVQCLNPQARQGRLYWLTERGKQNQRRLRRILRWPRLNHDLPVVDWSLYGWICFRHRAAVIQALSEPMQPATIRRKARSQNPGLRMSANNVRDVIRLFLGRGIGPWRLSASPALCIAFPNAYLDSLGLPRLATRGTA